MMLMMSRKIKVVTASGHGKKGVTTLTTDEAQNPNALLTMLVNKIVQDNNDDVVKIAAALERLRRENFLYKWSLTMAPSYKAQNPLAYRIQVERCPRKE
jgi:hypothetical protein